MFFRALYYSGAILYSLHGFYIVNVGSVLPFYYKAIRLFAAVVQIFLHLFTFTPHRCCGYKNIFSRMLYSRYFPQMVVICNLYLAYIVTNMILNILIYGVYAEIIGILILTYVYVYRLFVPISELHLE